MSLIKLAISNIKRNFSRYAMYFFSLSFSVFTTYSFLALLFNQDVSNPIKDDNRFKALIIGFGIIIMIFVLFFLISSNNSFIKARKKEISTYSLFGMTNGRIGRLLFLETLMVGSATLIIGIGLGIFFSKLISMILLNMTMSSYSGDIAFIIKPISIYMTVLIFTGIFCIMGVSGFRVISKFQLVELFKGDKVSEGKPKGSTILLILSLLLVGIGYYLAFSAMEEEQIIKLSVPILLLTVFGTYLFFWGGLPKILNIIKKRKGGYYEGVNLIAINAFSHKMKSIGSVMATIAILSAVATTVIASGFTLYRRTELTTYYLFGFDLYLNSENGEIPKEIRDVFDKHNTKIKEHYTSKRYKATPEYERLVIDGGEFLNSQIDYFVVYSQSDYNELIRLSKVKLDPVTVNSGEAIYVGYNLGQKFIDAIKGYELEFSKKNIVITSVAHTVGSLTRPAVANTLVLTDADLELLITSGDVLPDSTLGGTYLTVVNYENPLSSEELHADLQEVLKKPGSIHGTAYNHYTDTLALVGIICFVGFFMSAVFILMTASLLYFKQIVAAEEERHQYKMLRKIGMDLETEKIVITKRLAPVFLIPLVVGIIHSIFAMKTATSIAFSSPVFGDNPYLTVLRISLIMYVAYTLVYGLFYIITKKQYSLIVSKAR